MNIAIIGHRFMGRAHSNAWSQAPKFFDLPAKPILKVACGRDESALDAFAQNWGWQETSTDWQEAIARDDIDVIDIALPTHLHAEVAIAAAQAGKHIFCEKPVSRSTTEAEAMLAAAEETGIVHYLNHNYRRVPAIALAKHLIEEGSLGDIYHWRGAYQQSWLTDPNKPIDWKLRKATAGAGPHFDLGSHSVDLAHFLVGEIKSVSCLATNFIKERPLAENPAETVPVEVEDAALMMVEFQNGALGSFENTRFATGHRNRNTFEIYGSKGALTFDLQDMNRLQFYSNDDPPGARGFRDILATEPNHPYVGQWWPPGHIIGYEHSFVHAVADFVNAVDAGTQIAPNFKDGVQIMRVLEAALSSAESGTRKNF